MNTRWVWWLELLARVGLAAFFLFAGITKVVSPEDFARSIYQFRILPDVLINPLAVVLPWVECVAGICLLVPRWQDAAAALVALMSLVFAVAVVSLLWRGIRVSCGCFGGLSQSPANWGHVAFDASLAIVAIWTWWRGVYRHPGAPDLGLTRE
ncbi:MAG TPA: MauE/DoxX family redox-associated membrane protein [Planctomycetota bacterium]|jgi:uncharacterized membrane protein YphA (DoxX/SURF4 family)